ncbi:AAA family ATPase [Caldisphaera sp.]|uniref:AAA family ATPase n=1 Tax=Caldisphaera sp. TaxID=2060322 RepID=UPI003D0D198C
MGYYIIDSISLKNFLSHEDTKINFSPGSMALVGENGAGKSSILEALFFALTLKPWRDRSYLIKTNSSKAAVTVKLRELEGNNTLELIVYLTRRGKDGLNTEVTLKRNGKVEASKVEDYKNILKQYLNMQSLPDVSDFLQSSIIVKQNILSNIASKMSDSRKDFKELIESALGIKLYKEVEENLTEIDVKPNKNEESVGIYNIKQRHRDNLKEVIEKKKNEITNINKKLNEIIKNVREKETQKIIIENKKEEINNELLSLQNKIIELNVLKSKKDSIKSEINKIKSDINSIKSEIKSLDFKIAEIEKIRPIANMHNLVEDYDKLVDENRSLENEINQLEHIKHYYEKMSENSEIEKEYEELSKKIEELRKEIDSMKIDLARIKEINKNYNKKRDKINNILNINEKLLKNLVDINVLKASKDIADSLKSIIEKLEDYYEKLEKENEVNKEKEKEIGNKISTIDYNIKVMKNYITVLEKPGESSECPVCHSKLTGKTISDLKNSYIEEIKKHENELKELNKEDIELNNKIKLIENELKSLLNIINELKSISDEISDEMKVSEKKLLLISSELENKTKEFDEIKKKFDELEKGHNEYISALEYFKFINLDIKDISKKLEGYEKKVASYNEIKNKIKEIEKTLLRQTNSKTMEEAKSKIKDAESKINLLDKYKEDKEKYEQELINKKKELDEKVIEFDEINSKINSMVGIEEEIKKLKKEADDLENQYQKLIKEISTLEGEKKANEDSLIRLKNEIDALDEIEKKVTVGLASINIFDKIQRSLYNNALISLENEMNNVFSRFGLDYSRIEIRENSEGNLGVYVIDREGNERPISILSGGEQNVIALAFIIALNKIIQAKIGFLALDEPTESLDEQRRKILVEVLGKLTESETSEVPPPVYQLLLISHHSDIMDSIDQICSVKKEEGVSKVLCQNEESFR